MTLIFVIGALFLGLAVAIVPVAKNQRLGSVLGYLLAGVIAGLCLRGIMPLLGKSDAASLVNELNHLTEFGVVLMLFLIGLEMNPRHLWSMRHKIFGLGFAQLGITALVLLAACYGLGLSFKTSLLIGLSLGLSSTAIVLQTLNEKGWVSSTGGKDSFSVLLFQDIAVIPIIAILPLLVMEGAAPAGQQGHLNLIDQLPSSLQPVVLVLGIAAIFLLARYVVNPLLRYIASADLSELFTTAALALVMVIAALMSLIGLSPALGVFMAGVVLSESEFRKELETDIEPFKGILLGLFFMTVGAGFDFAIFFEQPFTLLGLAVGLMAVKFLVLFAVATIFKLKGTQKMLFALCLAQAGEFGFVLFQSAVSVGALQTPLAAKLKLICALSMALTPLLFLVYEYVILPRDSKKQHEEDLSHDVPSNEHRVIIAGFGRFGQIVVRMLANIGVKATVLDYSPSQIALLRRFGYKVFYGDACRMDLLRTAGIEQADLFVIAIDDGERSLELAREVKATFPKLPILVRARSRGEASQLHQMGIEHIFRETYEASLMMGESALKILGYRAFQARRIRQEFSRLDTSYLKKLAAVFVENRAEYVNASKQAEEQLGRLLREQLSRPDHEREGWQDPSVTQQQSS